MQIRNLNTVLWVVLLCGCAGKLDISNLELSSNVHEGCFSPTTTMDVYYYKNGFNQKYELLSPKHLGVATTYLWNHVKKYSQFLKVVK